MDCPIISLVPFHVPAISAPRADDSITLRAKTVKTRILILIGCTPLHKVGNFA
jgi:hypothetical protein